MGSERLSTVNAMCEQLVANGHQDAALINEWKDDLNEMWQSLSELLDTRREVGIFLSFGLSAHVYQASGSNHNTSILALLGIFLRKARDRRYVKNQLWFDDWN